MTTHVFHLGGMHCQACERLAEMELSEAPGVTAVKASLRSQTVEVTGAFAEQAPEEIARGLQPFVQAHGYSISLERPRHDARWGQFAMAIPAAAMVIAIFLAAQNLGLARGLGSPARGYGMAFVIGLVASVSSCMAVVGGLVLSLSATYAQRGERVRPQLLFHAGRLIGFLLLGGVAGAAGSVLLPGATATFVLGLLVGTAMMAMGFGLLDLHPLARRLQISLPRGMEERVHGLRAHRAGALPFLIGAATFFLPCGFTQSMQFYALTTGSFAVGALTMFVFALGTLPVLALLSFSPGLAPSAGRSGVFFKTAGLLVIFFGLYNILNSLVAYGVVPPLF